LADVFGGFEMKSFNKMDSFCRVVRFELADLRPALTALTLPEVQGED